MACHSGKVEFFRSFFGRIEDTKKDISKLTDLYLGTDYLLSKHIYFLLFTTKEVESVYFPNRISSEGKEPVVIHIL